jgi:hypothetical protein
VAFVKLSGLYRNLFKHTPIEKCGGQDRRRQGMGFKRADPGTTGTYRNPGEDLDNRGLHKRTALGVDIRFAI